MPTARVVGPTADDATVAVGGSDVLITGRRIEDQIDTGNCGGQSLRDFTSTYCNASHFTLNKVLASWLAHSGLDGIMNVNHVASDLAIRRPVDRLDVLFEIVEGP